MKNNEFDKVVLIDKIHEILRIIMVISAVSGGFLIIALLGVFSPRLINGPRGIENGFVEDDWTLLFIAASNPKLFLILGGSLLALAIICFCIIYFGKIIKLFKF